MSYKFSIPTFRKTVIKAFGEYVRTYPGSHDCMLLCNGFGIFAYSEEYINSGKVERLMDHGSPKYYLSIDDDTLRPEPYLKAFVTEQEVIDYLHQVDKWMWNRFKSGLAELLNKEADEALKVLD